MKNPTLKRVKNIEIYICIIFFFRFFLSFFPYVPTVLFHNPPFVKIVSKLNSDGIIIKNDLETRSKSINPEYHLENGKHFNLKRTNVACQFSINQRRDLIRL